jgi:hypothetical protein
VGARDPGQCNFQWTSSTSSKRVEKKKIALRGVLDIDGTFTVTIATPDANRKIFHQRIFPSMGST